MTDHTEDTEALNPSCSSSEEEDPDDTVANSFRRELHDVSRKRKAHQTAVPADANKSSCTSSSRSTGDDPQKKKRSGVIKKGVGRLPAADGNVIDIVDESLLVEWFRCV